eukprot:TRINITY_DN22730_c0_g1_i1.p1 TRINITY_DN22730_c0_g1~~TRINITY_DN22730_c0_g1_i1.p1  ORF type:complete len:539 (-),score=108.20 TRINITY_DN22730_c0_g1_i1:134-1750(-)
MGHSLSACTNDPPAVLSYAGAHCTVSGACGSDKKPGWPIISGCDDTTRGCTAWPHIAKPLHEELEPRLPLKLGGGSCVAAEDCLVMHACSSCGISQQISRGGLASPTSVAPIAGECIHCGNDLGVFCDGAQQSTSQGRLREVSPVKSASCRHAGSRAGSLERELPSDEKTALRIALPKAARPQHASRRTASFQQDAQALSPPEGKQPPKPSDALEPEVFPEPASALTVSMFSSSAPGDGALGDDGVSVPQKGDGVTAKEAGSPAAGWLPPGWKQAQDHLKRPYYYNRSTGECTYKRPRLTTKAPAQIHAHSASSSLHTLHLAVDHASVVDTPRSSQCDAAPVVLAAAACDAAASAQAVCVRDESSSCSTATPGTEHVDELVDMEAATRQLVFLQKPNIDSDSDGEDHSEAAKLQALQWHFESMQFKAKELRLDISPPTIEEPEEAMRDGDAALCEGAEAKSPLRGCLSPTSAALKRAKSHERVRFALPSDDATASTSEPLGGQAAHGDIAWHLLPSAPDPVSKLRQKQYGRRRRSGTM